MAPQVDIEMERATPRGAADPRLDAMMAPRQVNTPEPPSRTMRALAAIAWVSFFLFIFIAAVRF